MTRVVIKPTVTGTAEIRRTRIGRAEDDMADVGTNRADPPVVGRVVINSVRQGGRPGGVRLTRRGRIVLIVLVAVVLLVGFWVTARRGAGASSADADRSWTPGMRLETVEVGRHDTLWGIASRGRPEADPRITVRRIMDLNGLSTAIVQPGQRLKVPSR